MKVMNEQLTILVQNWDAEIYVAYLYLSHDDSIVDIIKENTENWNKFENIAHVIYRIDISTYQEILKLRFLFNISFCYFWNNTRKYLNYLYRHLLLLFITKIIHYLIWF